ncbi:gap junction delta-3 protein [Terrapene carolina triunguis]|uniref:gap junction delta-3 protein n=1 Tax=Terrapene triunguis TaxID=2587831 RepID=UPI000CEFCED8|nr:gap junction delta-3 protein [Terrapene carolina triunguis]
MGEWSFLSSLLDAVQEHSPMVGRFWLVVMLIFRILILATVGSDIFEDEQEEFVCNTLQPGCKQVCYDKAFPISHYRFWVFHIVVLSAPALLFVMYAMHQSGKLRQGEEGGSAGPPRLQPSQRTHHVRTFYLVNVAMRILAESSFLVGQWQLYGFHVEPHFTCQRSPCPHHVDCFVSRPTEKTIFILFYFVVGVVSTLLSLVELAHLLAKDRCQRTAANKPPAASYEQQENWSNQAHEQCQHFLPPGDGGAKGTACSVPNHYEPSAPFRPQAPSPGSKASQAAARADLLV